MLVDIGLPGMNGYELARRVRKDPSLQGVALVALTGYGRDEDKTAAIAAGFDDHLVKPVDPENIERFMRRLGRRRWPARRSSRLDPDARRVLLVENDPESREGCASS
jgi:CheY-like chemotaxis protein